MNVIREIDRINVREVEAGIIGGITKGSWHDKYRDSAWVYMGGMSFELSEGDIICFMSQWGEIEDINLVRDKTTNKSLGYAFIKYEDQRSTILAVDNFNGMKLLGRTIRCDHVDRYKLPKDIREKEEEKLENDPDAEVEIGPGHTYNEKDLANEFNIKEGVDLWAAPGSSAAAALSAKAQASASSSDDDDDGDKIKNDSNKKNKHDKKEKKKKEKKEKKENKVKAADKSNKGGGGRSRSNSRERSHGAAGARDDDDGDRRGDRDYDRDSRRRDYSRDRQKRGGHHDDYSRGGGGGGRRRSSSRDGDIRDDGRRDRKRSRSRSSDIGVRERGSQRSRFDRSDSIRPPASAVSTTAHAATSKSTGTSNSNFSAVGATASSSSSSYSSSLPWDKGSALASGPLSGAAPAKYDPGAAVSWRGTRDPALHSLAEQEKRKAANADKVGAKRDQFAGFAGMNRTR